nr:MAG TPA: hypothetical protein [Caudoviricetes sp.]
MFGILHPSIYSQIFCALKIWNKQRQAGPADAVRPLRNTIR